MLCPSQACPQWKKANAYWVGRCHWGRSRRFCHQGSWLPSLPAEVFLSDISLKAGIVRGLGSFDLVALLSLPVDQATDRFSALYRSFSLRGWLENSPESDARDEYVDFLESFRKKYSGMKDTPEVLTDMVAFLLEMPELKVCKYLFYIFQLSCLWLTSKLPEMPAIKFPEWIAETHGVDCLKSSCLRSLTSLMWRTLWPLVQPKLLWVLSRILKHDSAVVLLQEILGLMSTVLERHWVCLYYVFQRGEGGGQREQSPDKNKKVSFKAASSSGGAKSSDVNTPGSSKS